MIENTAFSPNWVSPPGDTIVDLLEERGWGQVDLALRSNFSSKHVNKLIKGKVPISADAAERLAKVLGSTVEFWLTREAQYRAALARKEALSECARHTDWLKDLPVAWMRKQGFLPDSRQKALLVDHALRWFGVSSVAGWMATYQKPLTAFRAAKKLDERIGTVAAWLRAAELKAAQIDCRPFNREELLRRLGEIRSLAAEEKPEVFVPRLQAIGASCGVAIVFVPAPSGCPVHGATRWLTSDRALLALSLRYRSNDQLWFSLFHEMAHLLKHGKKLFLVEGLDGLDAALEKEADRFAADTLIPPGEVGRLQNLRRKQDVQATAKAIGIAAGVVVGRMQHERWITHSQLNELKVFYSWENTANG